MGGGGDGSAVRKIYCTGPSKLATIPLYNPLKSPVDLDLAASKALRTGPYKSYTVKKENTIFLIYKEIQRDRVQSHK